MAFTFTIQLRQQFDPPPHAKLHNHVIINQNTMPRHPVMFKKCFSMSHTVKSVQTDNSLWKNTKLLQCYHFLATFNNRSKCITSYFMLLTKTELFQFTGQHSYCSYALLKQKHYIVPDKTQCTAVLMLCGMVLLSLKLVAVQPVRVYYTAAEV